MYTSNKINSSYHLVIFAVSPFKGKTSTGEIVWLTSPESSLPPHTIPAIVHLPYIYSRTNVYHGKPLGG